MRNNRSADLDVLRYMLNYTLKIEQLIDRFGKDYEIFKNDVAYRDAVSMNILQIGELTARLSEDFKEATKSKLPWSAMKNMRNLFAHNYGQMDIEIIWTTAIENIPEVKAFCEEEINK